MAVGLDSYAPYDSGLGASVTEATWRNFMQYMTGRLQPSMNGVIHSVANSFAVYADSSGMQVKVKTGEAWIKGAWGSSTAEKILPIAAADPTNPRKDRVVLRNDFVNNRIEVDVKTGTPAGSPSAPAVSQGSTLWETSLAVVDVPATNTIVAASQVRDSRSFVDEPRLTRYLTGDQTVTNSITLLTPVDLTHTVSPNARYAVEGWIEYTATTTGDMRSTITGSTGIAGRVAGSGLEVGTPGFAGSYDGGSVAVGTVFGSGGAGTGTKVVSRVSGWVLCPDASDPGASLTVSFSFAQNVAEASTVTVYAGSWIRLTRLA